MKADRCPTDPFTTMSMPFIEMPQRAEALPSITSRPPQPVAPARLRGVALHMDAPGHHVFGDALAGVAVDHDGRAACSCRRSSSRHGPRSRRVIGASRPTAIACCPRGLSTRQCVSLVSGLRRVQRRVELAQRASREIDGAQSVPLPEIHLGRLRLPDPGRCRCRADRPARDTPCRTRPSGRSRPSPPACRRSDRAARRSRSRCRPRRCRSRRARSSEASSACSSEAPSRIRQVM